MQLRKPLSVAVPGIGQFSFAHRTFRDEIKIQVETARLLDGESNVPKVLQQFALMFATLHVLTQKAPAGWDLDTLDPLDDTSYDRLEGVFIALREAESNFRARLSGGSEGDSEGAGGAD